MLLYSRASAVSGHHIITMETRHLSLSSNVAQGNVLTSLLADRQTRGERKQEGTDRLETWSRHGDTRGFHRKIFDYYIFKETPSVR